MPRLTHALPRYRRHASGQAIVEFSKRVHYLGPYGSPESHQAYYQLTQFWANNDRQPISKAAAATILSAGSLKTTKQPTEAPAPPLAPPAPVNRSFTVIELAARFWEHAQQRYMKYGRQTGTHTNYRPVLRLLKEIGALPVDQFGPRRLKELIQKMIDAGQSQRYVNDNISRLRRVFRWGAACFSAALQWQDFVATGMIGAANNLIRMSLSE